MAGNYPPGMTSRDYAHVYGEQYAPDAPRSERIEFEGNEYICFDYTVIPIGGGEFDVQVEVTGFVPVDLSEGALDFERVRTFEDAESAQDWVYSFMEEELSYEQTKEAIKRGG